jgi:phenylacetate-CoA ligase
MPDRFESREAIREHQLKALQQLLTAILPHNRFYERKLAAAGIRSLEAFTEQTPFTTKQELVDDQAAHPPYGTNLTYPLTRYTRFHQTSGTTSAPLRWLDTQESWEWMLGNWREIMLASGVQAGDRVFFAFSFGPFIGFWLAFETAVRLGALAVPGGGMGSAARVRAIRDNAITVLCCTPTYALRLAEVAMEEGVAQTSLKRLLVAGEPGGSLPATRARIEQAWPGAAVFDHHGMTEIGPVTYQCPDRAGVLHVLDRSYIAEVIDPATGKPISLPGATGELVLTNLGRTGSPLLRYRTGDLVKPISCPCGRAETALDGGILGRVDDMTIIRGVNVYPSAVEQIIRSVPGIAEYQVRVSTGSALSELNVAVEPAQGVDSGALVKTLENAFQAALALRVGVSIAPADSLPRFEMKARRWTKA